MDDTKIKEIASKRAEVEHRIGTVSVALENFDKITQGTPEGKALKFASDGLGTAKQELAELEAAYHLEQLEKFKADGTDKYHGGSISLKPNNEYKEKDGIAYVIMLMLRGQGHGLLSLKKSNFNKVIKGDVPSFVTVRYYPSTSLDKDLSRYLDE